MLTVLLQAIQDHPKVRGEAGPQYILAMEKSATAPYPLQLQSQLL